MTHFIRIITIFFLTGVFLSGSISMIEEWSDLTDLTLLVSYIGIIAIYLFFYKGNLKFPISITIIYAFFLLFTFSSSLMNESMQSFLSSFRYLLTFIVLTIIIPEMFKEKTFSITIVSVFLSQIPLIILSILEENPFQDLSGSYLGIFYNTNSFGGVVATLFVFLLVLLFKYMGTKKVVTQFTLFLLLCTFFLLTVFSGSRTSFVAIIVVTFISFTLYLLKNFTVSNFSIKKLGYIFILLIALCSGLLLFLKSKYFELFNVIIVGKFIRKHESGDVLDQRGGIWKDTISDMTILGNGPHYFTDVLGIGAHNTFISILGQFGILVSVMFVLIWIVTLYKSVQYYVQRNISEYNLLPITIVLFFLLTSLTEIMLMKVSMLFSMIVIGVITSKREKT